MWCHDTSTSIPTRLGSSSRVDTSAADFSTMKARCWRSPATGTATRVRRRPSPATCGPRTRRAARPSSTTTRFSLSCSTARQVDTSSLAQVIFCIYQFGFSRSYFLEYTVEIVAFKNKVKMLIGKFINPRYNPAIKQCIFSYRT